MGVLEKIQIEGKSEFEQRARYVCNVNGFDFSFPRVDSHQFLAERDKAFDSATPTGPIALDVSDSMACAYAATTPTLLCRYIKVCAGEETSAAYVASGEVCYVMSGRGESRNGDDCIAWKTGDVFCFPGGAATMHRASEDSLLFNVTDEPLFAFAGANAPDSRRATVETVHWRAEEIDENFNAVFKRPITEKTTGASVQFSTRRTEPNFTTTPFINCAINTLATSSDQRPHRHNGVAVTLAIQGEGIHSMIDGQRIDWVTGAAQITPAASLHSHHNRGNKRMRSFVIQDEGLHIYTRTPGFSFD